MQVLDATERDNRRGIGKCDHNNAVSRAKSSAVSSNRVAPASKAILRNASRSIPNHEAAVPDDNLPSF